MVFFAYNGPFGGLSSKYYEIPLPQTKNHIFYIVLHDHVKL
jgi:hypothetical protein